MKSIGQNGIMSASVFQIAAVKACTDQVYPELKSFEPRKRSTLGEFVKEYESQKQDKSQKFGGFIPASQLEMGK